MTHSREQFARSLVLALRARDAIGSGLSYSGIATSIDPTYTDKFVAWMAGEDTKAAFNPMATTLRVPNSTQFNSAGVQNYPDYATGVEATIHTLLLPYYVHVLEALSSPYTLSDFAHAVEVSPWGTKHIPYNVDSAMRDVLIGEGDD